MSYKKIIIISILLLISLTAVSASDVDNITIQTIDEEIIDYSDNFVGNSNEDMVLDASLNDLQSLVNSVSNGGTLDLNTDFSGGKAVKISKSITINGNNHVLDANSKDCIFSLSDGVNVVLKNIVFKNGYLDNGGAISNYYKSSSLTLINCNFLSNYAKISGGAIYTTGNLNIEGCTFSSNVVDDDDGGAIYAIGKTTIRSSIFSDNNVVGSVRNVCNGGAIFLFGDSNTIDSCKFNNNFADDNGGAIYSEGNLNVYNSTFEYNVADDDDGGAIYADGTLNVENCYFGDNAANDDDGGAIYCKKNLNVIRSNFYSNKAFVDGGAIFCEAVTTITNSRFAANRAEGSDSRCFGGAVRSKGVCYIIGCEFSRNFAEDYGGAIYADGILSIIGNSFLDGEKWIHCSFTANSAIDYGGAIYVGGTLYINWQTSNLQTDINQKESNNTLSDDSKVVDFVSNDVREGDGGGIYCCGNAYINNAVCFYNMAAVDGGVIYCKRDLNVVLSYIYQNNAQENGGAIRSKGNCYIDSTLLDSNEVGDCGGAIYADEDLIINGGSIISSNKANERGGGVYVDGSVYINWNLENSVRSCFMSNRVYDDNGGSLYCCGNAYINNAEFGDSDSEIDGGAIFSKGETHVRNSEFYCNRAMTRHIADFHSHYGGAIYSAGLITVEGSNFQANSATSRGGAIYSDKEIIVSNSRFRLNSAGDHGGAIYAEKFEQLSNSIFIQNSVNEDGGAIYINANCDPNIVSCLFSRNSCGDEGGAIYLDSAYSLLKISYCTFIGNHADDKGQAVYCCGNYEYVDYCWYGTNNPSFSDMFKIYHRLSSDDDYGVSNYAKINLKVNDTNLFVGNKYQLSVYFTSNTGSALSGEIIGYDASFTGNGVFSNNKMGYNEISTDVVFTKEYPTVSATIDGQSVYLSPNVINKYSSTVNILSCEDIIYPESFKVNFEVINRSKVSFAINDNQGKVVKQGDIGDGENSVVVDGLNPGNYSITISNSESFDTLSSNTTANFRVKPLYNVVVSANDVVYGEITTITLKSDIDGLFNVNIDDYGLIQMDVINGSATHQLKLNSGIYYTHTTINTDDFAIKCTEARFVVDSLPAHISLIINSTFTYPNNIAGEIIADVPGVYGIHIGDKLMATVNITNTSAKFNAGVLRPGINYIVSAGIMERNYFGVASSRIDVVKGNFEGYSLHISDSVYSKDLIAESHTSMENHFVLEIGDYKRPIYVRESGLTVNLGSKWDAGLYNAKLVFEGDDFYLPSSYSTLFTVYKANSDLNLKVKVLSSSEGFEVSHTLSSHATGYIEYYLNGAFICNLSVDKNLNLDPLDSGHYVLVAKYCGDENYNSSYDTIEININSQLNKGINSSHDNKPDELIKSSKESNKQILVTLDNSYSFNYAVGEVVKSNTNDLTNNLTNNSNGTSPVKSIDSKSNDGNFNFLWILLLLLIIAIAGVLIKKYKN